jgi:hypothetical protein
MIKSKRGQKNPENQIHTINIQQTKLPNLTIVSTQKLDRILNKNFTNLHKLIRGN